MSDKEIKNLPGSVRQRLLNIAKDKGEDFQLFLDRYAAERFLYRLSKSEYSSGFALKGATLFAIWSEAPYRSTRDIDLLVWGNNSVSQLEELFRHVCNMDVEDDGLVFDRNTLKATEINEDEEYTGVRVNLITLLGVAKANVQIDVGFGDVITPKAVEVQCPSILGFPSAVMLAYPMETVIAEKVQAMVMLGMVNSRLKDFSDIHHLASKFEFQGSTLCEALRTTFARRQTELPKDIPTALTERYYGSGEREAQWKAFKKKTAVKSPLTFAETCLSLQQFLMPPLTAVGADEPFTKTWRPSGPCQ